METYLVHSTATEQSSAKIVSASTAMTKSNSNSDMGMEIGNEGAEEEVPNDKHQLSGVVVCFSKKVAAQESKSL